jgi:hypothetical protein
MAVPNIGLIFGSMIYPSLIVIIFGLNIMFVLMLFRRIWLDMEQLDFPIAKLGNQLVDMTQREDEKGSVKLFKSKFFWLGFAIQFIWLLVEIVPNLNLSAEGWNLTNVMYGSENQLGGMEIIPRYDLSSLGLISSPLILMLEPWRIGWTSMLSLEVLTSFLIGWVIFWIILPSPPLVMWAWGPTGPPSWGGGYEGFAPLVAGYTYSGGWEGPQVHLMAIGMMISILAISVWRNRRAFGPIMMGLFKEPEEEIDPDRPFSYRIIWIGALSTFIIGILLQLVLSIELQFFVILWVVWMVMVVSFARLTSETGMNLGSAGTLNARGWWMYVLTLVFYGIFGVLWSGANVSSYHTMWFWTFTCGTAIGAGLFLMSNYTASFSSASWKMGKDTKTLAKNVVIVSIIGIVVAAILMRVFQYTWISMFPVNDWSFNKWDGVCSTWVYWNLNAPEGMWAGAEYGTWLNYTENSMNYWLKLIAGMIIPVVVVLLRSRLSWFRVSAAGIAFGAWFGYEFWGAIIVATIIKYTLQRIGGTKLQTEKWQPLATGMIMGMLLAYLIFGPILNPWGGFLRNPGAF